MKRKRRVPQAKQTQHDNVTKAGMSIILTCKHDSQTHSIRLSGDHNIPDKSSVSTLKCCQRQHTTVSHTASHSHY